MSSETWRWILLLLVAVHAGFDFWLDALNFRHSQSAPRSESDVMSEAEHAKSLRYQSANYRIGQIESATTTLLSLAAIGLGWFGALDNWLHDRTDQPILLVLYFLWIMLVALSLLGLPFSIYRTFVIERRFDFNRTSPKQFIRDLVVELPLTAALGGIVLGLVAYLYQSLGNSFWIASWVAISAFLLFMFAFQARFILPLFNKLTEVPEGELRTAIERYCREQGYSIGRMFVMDASKRSTKANAFFTGIGPAKTIGLYDTLVERMDTEEVVAVVAHEVGHYKRKHTLEMLTLSVVQMLLFCGLFGALTGVPEVATALGGAQFSLELGLVGFVLLLNPLSLLISLVINTLTRRNEFEADRFSIETYPGPYLRQSLTKMAQHHLSNEHPHPLYVRVHYSHPPIKQRLAQLP